MSYAFELIVVGVTVGGILLSLTRYFRPLLVARETGRVGDFFEHTEDRMLDEHPDGNRNDPPIPLRPLRPRA
jgi:hypothetical protein